MLTLIIETAGRPTRTMRVERFPCRIGRARESDVVLEGWRVARGHAELDGTAILKLYLDEPV